MGPDDARPRSSVPVDLPTDLIVIGKRLRPIDPVRVANLQVSMRENRFIGSITVRPLPAGDTGRFKLVVGAHRITAWRNEGGRTIPSQIRILSDDEAEQIEIDENLVRDGLSPLERAEMVARRFEVWGRRFPDRVAEGDLGAAPKRGRPEKGLNLSQFPGGAAGTMGFAADTAAQIGLSKATIKRAWSVVNGIPADVRRELHGTPIARNESLLRQLASIGDRAEQLRVANVLIEGKTKSVSDAMAIAAGNTPSRPAQTPVDVSVKAFRKVWADATPSARAAILHELAGRSLPKGWIVREATDA